MKTVDFSRSFLTFRRDTDKKPSQTSSNRQPYALNNARIQLDCVCAIEDRSGYREEFALGANCKSERVGVERDIWTEPNADFVPVFGRDRFMNIKTYDCVGKSVKFYPPTRGEQPERQVGVIADVFDKATVDIVRTQGELLQTPQEIVESTLRNEPLVAITKLTSPRYSVVLEYPIKTINANERDWVYQTDTGPVLLPNCELDPDDLISGMQLGFSAFSGPVWIEFIERVPTPISSDIAVYHYSKPFRMDALNSVVRLI